MAEQSERAANAGAPAPVGKPPPGAPFDPGPPDPGPPGDRLRLLAYFLPYLRPVRGLLALVLATTVVMAVTPLPMNFLPMVLTEHFDDRAYLYFYLGFVLLSILIGGALGVLHAWWGERLGETMLRTLRHDVFSNLERLSMLAVYSKGPGQFVQQIGRDVSAVRELITGILLRSAVEIAMGVSVLISMLILQPLLTVILGITYAATIWPVRFINRRVEHHSGRAREIMHEIMGRLVEYVGGFRDIVAAGRFGGFTNRFDHMLRANQQENVRTAVWAQSSGLLPAMLVSLLTLTAYFITLQRAISVAEVGGIITYAMFLSQLFPALFALTRMSTDLAMATPSLRALKELLDQPPLPPVKDLVPLKGTVQSIRFEHVSLELDGRRVLDDLSFDIPGGKLTAIVGQSGAGKTTVFHLLLRLIEPTTGAILINGRPAKDYTPESLRESVGFIPQNPFIFNESLRDNILLATPEDVSPASLAQAVELAQLDEVVARRQDQGGLEAVAGYMGSRLSGGEKQRIALARLMLRDPQVIICDEYTANVDVKTARLIHEAMRTHFAGRTRVVITHELATVRGADHIVVIDHGQVVQQGTHELLRAEAGLYRELLEVQSV